jgi:hypothetical protein
MQTRRHLTLADVEKIAEAAAAFHAAVSGISVETGLCLNAAAYPSDPEPSAMIHGHGAEATTRLADLGGTVRRSEFNRLSAAIGIVSSDVYRGDYCAVAWDALAARVSS